MEIVKKLDEYIIKVNGATIGIVNSKDLDLIDYGGFKNVPK